MICGASRKKRERCDICFWWWINSSLVMRHLLTITALLMYSMRKTENNRFIRISGFKRDNVWWRWCKWSEYIDWQTSALACVFGGAWIFHIVFMQNVIVFVRPLVLYSILMSMFSLDKWLEWKLPRTLSFVIG